MEFDRRVQIRVTMPGTDRKRFGSGYLVAPRLVLTAAHVLGGMDPVAPVVATVCQPDTSGAEFTATVRWQRRGGTVDAALIEVDEGQGWPVPESLAEVLTRPPQRYGRLIGTRPHPVTLTGFPRMQKDPESGSRWDKQLDGHISLGTGALAGRYEVSSRDPTVPPDPSTDEASRWPGISGAAVLADDGQGQDLLCGVVRQDRQADGGTLLTTTPSSALFADPDFRDLLTKHTGWEPAVEPVEPAPLLKPAAFDRNLNSLAALLRADAGTVTFHGRDNELADLHRWCTTSTTGLALRVITGPGGQGKTRLARRLTDLLSYQNWATGHLRTDLNDALAPGGASPDFTTLETALPLLLVIDYAETRPLLLRALITQLHRTRHRVRILLLARTDGPWRTDALNAAPAVRDVLEATPVTPLAPLIPTSRPTQERRAAFDRAALDIARLMPHLPTLPARDWHAVAAGLQPAEDLGHPRYDNVLTLQMAALVALVQHGPTSVDAPPGIALEQTLLRHEERFWVDSADAPAFKLSLPTPVLRAAVAVATLCGAATKDEAVQATLQVPELPPDKAIRTAEWLASLYPADPSRYWGSLQPDRIAEYHASHILTNDGISLPTLLAAVAPGQQVQLITVLARAANAHYNDGRTSDSRQVLHLVDKALETAPLSRQVIGTAVATLPYPSHVTAALALRLSAALVQATQQLAERNWAAYRPDLAAALDNLGSRLSEAGRHAEALTATERAVMIRRLLASGNLPAYEPDLAASLDSLGSQLLRAGRQAEALTASQHAVNIYRRLAAGNPAEYEPHLARSLNNFGIRLSEAGRQPEALTASQQAVEIYRRHAACSLTDYEPSLAGALDNLGNQLSEAGQQAEALTATRQAVEIYRGLAAANPAAYEPYLARSLFNLGLRLKDGGGLSESLSAAEQGRDIFRRLAAENPPAYEGDFAHALILLGGTLSEAGREVEALTATEQAVEIYRRLAAGNLTAYEPYLAGALDTLGNRLSEAGQRPGALTATQQAVEIYRRLAAANPAAYEPHLARSLNNLGIRLSEAGRQVEALIATEQALTIRSRLAVSNPAVYQNALAASLYHIGNRLSEAGRQDEALSATEQAADLYRRLPVHNPVDRAALLHNLAVRLSVAGRQDEALTATEQAVEIYRRLVAANPAAYEPHLASSLNNLGIQLSDVGRWAEALAVTEEAVETYRRHIAAKPALLPRLHAVLDLQAHLLDELGCPEDAASVRRWLADHPLPA